MSDTPISDSTPHNIAELGMLCRRLECQLNAANDRIKRLEEAGDGLYSWIERETPITILLNWSDAMEDKL